MTTVAEAVPALLDRLGRLERYQALGLVRPAASAEGVVQALQAERLQPIVPVVEWFAAWDGQTASGTLGLMDVLPGFYALSLQDALTHKRAHPLPRTWLPLLADGGGDFYVVDTGDPAGSVLRVRYDPAAQSTAPSLSTFVELALRAFDEGVIFVQDGYLDQDEAAWSRLLARDE